MSTTLETMFGDLDGKAQMAVLKFLGYESPADHLQCNQREFHGGHIIQEKQADYQRSGTLSCLCLISSYFTPPALMPQLTHSALRLRRLGYVGLKQMVRFGNFASEVFRYGKNQKCKARKQ